MGFRQLVEQDKQLEGLRKVVLHKPIRKINVAIRVKMLYLHQRKAIICVIVCSRYNLSFVVFMTKQPAVGPTYYEPLRPFLLKELLQNLPPAGLLFLASKIN